MDRKGCYYAVTHSFFVGLTTSLFGLKLIAMSDQEYRDHDDGLAVQDSKQKLAKPPMYKVFIMNDDYTPMEFVVEILESFFRKSREEATEIMLLVHNSGKGLCGVYSRDVAETKVMQVNDCSREHTHPLLCTLEQS
jgi:ATP-dependent Clp protease adaptor protein ClpS